MSNKNRFTIDIGDFSHDGHQLTHQVVVECAKNLATARNALFDIESVTGINVFGICHSYMDDIIPDDVLLKLRTLGYHFPVKLFVDDMGTHMLNGDTMEDIPEVFADMVVFLMNIVNKDLHAKIVEAPVLPSLLFCGPDNWSRRCGSLGYGLFARE